MNTQEVTRRAGEIGCIPAVQETRWAIGNSGMVRVFLLDLVLMFSPVLLYGQSSSAIQFTNATAEAGIKFVHFKGANRISINREEFGPGVCVADYGGHGWQDIRFVNGRDLYNRGIFSRNALYHNNGDGTFTEVTDAAGVPGTGYGLGCVWGDYGNDGCPDLHRRLSRMSKPTRFTSLRKALPT